jgi:hypothetical protein
MLITGYARLITPQGPDGLARFVPPERNEVVARFRPLFLRACPLFDAPQAVEIAKRDAQKPPEHDRGGKGEGDDSPRRAPGRAQRRGDPKPRAATAA